MKYKAITTSLSLQTLYELTEIFKLKDWKKEDCFDRYCAMLSNLIPEQQELILELTRNFLKIDFTSYMNYLIKTISEIPDERLNGINKLYVLPLLTPDDIDKSKSGIVIHYLFKTHEINSLNIFSNNKLKVIDTPNQLPNNFNAKQVMLLLVDDFVGSGETAIRAIEDITKKYGVAVNKIIILSLVAQQKAIDTIRQIGVETFTSVARKRGITDSYIATQREQYISLMQSIEDFLVIKENLRFGYNKSEALVSMARTPNNTFPIFWYERGEKIVAPFPRW